jgi:hypothetical protein
MQKRMLAIGKITSGKKTMLTKEGLHYEIQKSVLVNSDQDRNASKMDSSTVYLIL